MDSVAGPSGLDPVETLAEEYLQRRRRGEHPTLEEYAAQFPEHAGRILELFPALELLERLKPTPEDHSGRSEDTGTVCELPGLGSRAQRLGDYTLLRELGRGGMGIVYEAEHESLKNRVALKVMHPRFRADRTYLRRFQTEARSAARLHHTSIVPVFDFGEHDGVCYYAMQYIDGIGLDRVLDDVRHLRADSEGASYLTKEGQSHSQATEAVGGRISAASRSLLTGRFATAASTLGGSAPAPTPSLDMEHRERPTLVGIPARLPSDPSAADGAGSSSSSSLAGRPEAAYFREIARLGAQIADALDHAHHQNVVHRDIKPSNLLLDDYGNPWVTDFGLAKLVDGDDVSQSHELAGTLRFMAPERFRGATDPMGDVYSLGATLYELLTLKPAFAERDHARLIDQIRHELPAPLRQHDRRIPRDLETLVLKALAKDPKDRFVSAAELGDELRRYLESRPIRSRPVGTVEWLWRWSKRNPGLSAAVLVALLGISTALVLQIRANRALRKSNDALRIANGNVVQTNAALHRSQAAVQARYDLAVEAIKRFHTGVSEDFLLREELFQELRDRLLKSASEFYGTLGALSGRESDPASRQALAAANFEVAELTAKVGRKEDALAAHRNVLAAREALASEPGVGDEARADIGRSLIAIGSLMDQTGETNEAVQTYRRAETLLACLVGRDPGADQARSSLADCRCRLGVLLKRTGHTADALAMFRLARGDQEELAGKVGAPAGVRNDLATTIGRIALMLSGTGQQVPEAEPEYRAAMAIRRKLVHDYPAVTEFRNGLALIHNNFALLLAALGRSAEAESEYRAAVAIRRRLIGDHPAVTEFRNGLASVCANLGILLKETARPEDAEVEFRASLALSQKLADDHPAVTGFQNALAVAHNNLGEMLSITSRPAEAEVEFRAALAIRRKLVADHPAVPEFRHRLTINLHNLGQLLLSAGHFGAAETEYREALAISQKLVAAQPKVLGLRSQLADHHSNLGVVLASTGRSSEAAVEHRAAMALFQKLVDDEPTVPYYRDRLGNCRDKLGSLLVQAGQPAAAAEEYEWALALFRKLTEDYPATTSYQHSWAIVAMNLAVAQLSLGRHAEARTMAEKAVALCEGLLAKDSRSIEHRDGLCEGLLRLGQARRAGGDSAGATADWRRAVATFEAMPARQPRAALIVAGCHAMLAAASAEGGGSGGSARDGPIEADRAMDLLRRAVAMGFRDTSQLRAETALAPVRNRADFRLLIMDVEMPDEPFAAGG
jgi:eukaryotic-like serine/threonine-protein kinase